MSILAWIEDQKRLKLLNAPKYVNPTSDSSKGLWTRCDKCGVILYIKHLRENQGVCFGCSYHLQMSSQERVETLLDRESWRPFDETVSPCDPLGFCDQKGYTDRLQDAQEKTGLQDAIQTGTGMVDGIPLALGVMDFGFMGGSMGSVVGEKVTRLIEYATQEGLPLVLVCASGGARMQEGVFSLMQMAKISSALQVYQSCANLLYISLLTSPTTGGVTASFAMLGDIIFAEPKALIAFAGRRVIEQTLCEDLPEDFQTSEYMLHHGLVDLIIPRRFLRQALSESIRLYKNAPFKRHGRIPFGVQNPISFVTEEKLRRQLGKQGQGGLLPSQGQAGDIPLDYLEDKQKLGRASTGTEDVGKHMAKGGVANTTTLLTPHAHRREPGERNMNGYRQILTSFESMFHLMSNQMLLSDTASSHARDVSNSRLQDGAKGQQGLPPSGHLSQERIQDLLARFEESSSRALPVSKHLQPLPGGPPPREGATGMPPNGEKQPLVEARGGDLRESSLDDSNDLVHQALSLAATESVEWRAFYVHQHLSRAAGFVEDILHDAATPPPHEEGGGPQEGGNPNNRHRPDAHGKGWDLSAQNHLLYRAVSQGGAVAHARATS